MNRIILTATAALSLLQTPSILASFELSFSGPGVVEGDVATTVQFEVDCILAHSLPGGGAQGWSFGAAATNARIVRITTDGTAVDTYTRPPGFKVNELTSGAANEGAISAVVLDLTNSQPLPPGGIYTIARLTVEVDVTARSTSGALFYAAGLQGRGQPVGIGITEDFETKDPLLRRFEFTIRPSTPPPAAPGELSTLAVQIDRIELHWNDNSDGEDEFVIERRGPTASSFEEIARVGPDVERFTDRGLCPETSYTYRVFAERGGIPSLYSNELTKRTFSATGQVGIDTALAKAKKGRWSLLIKKGIFRTGAGIPGQGFTPRDDIRVEVDGRMFFGGAGLNDKVKVDREGNVAKVKLKLGRSKAVFDLVKGRMKLSLDGIPEPTADSGFRRISLRVFFGSHEGEFSFSGERANPKKANKLIFDAASGSLAPDPGACVE